MAIRRGIRRLGRRTAGMLALVAVLGAVQLHHSDMDMGAMHHDGGMPAVMTVCLAALCAVGAAVVAIAVGMLALGRWPVVQRRCPRVSGAWQAPRWALARAGPPPSLLFCVIRR